MTDVTVEEEYKRNPEINRKIIKQIIDWGRTQPHLPPLDEFYVIQYYHSKLYDIERTKKSLESYYTYRTQYTDLFSNLDIQSHELQQAMNLITLAILPGTTPEGYRILYWRFNDLDSSKFDFISCLKLYILFATTIIFEIGTCPGYICMLDFYGAKFSHLARVNMISAMHSIRFVQKALPFRLHYVELVHFFLGAPISMIAPFIRKDLMSKFKLRKRTCEVDTFPLELLPCEYTYGKGPSIKELREKWINLIVARREKFLMQERTHKTDELKRTKIQSSWF